MNLVPIRALRWYRFKRYSGTDSPILSANQICAALDRAGISYFINRKNISGGLEFIDVIIQAINQSLLFLFLASTNS